MRAQDAAGIADQLGWIGDRVTVDCDGVLVSAWVVVDEDEHHRRGGAGAVASIEELHRAIGPAGGAPASVARPLRIVGVASGPTRWRDAAAAVGRYVTVAPRVVVLAGDDAHDDMVRTEARMWGVGLLVDSELVDRPAPAEREHGIYQRWLAEECYQAWLTGPTSSSG